MTTGHINRSDIEDAKKELVRRRTAARQAKITTTLAGIEVNLEELVLANADSPVLTMVGKLLEAGSTEDALMALVEDLGEDGFMSLLRQLGNQPQPAQQLPAGQVPPAALPSGQQPAQTNAIVIPEYLEVYDENGQPEHWTIKRDDGDAESRANARGYYRTVLNGTAVYQKRRSATPAVQPAPSGPTPPSWWPTRRRSGN
jgi:hypothetical protein